MALTQVQPEAMSRDEFLKAMVSRLDGKRLYNPWLRGKCLLVVSGASILCDPAVGLPRNIWLPRLYPQW